MTRKLELAVALGVTGALLSQSNSERDFLAPPDKEVISISDLARLRESLDQTPKFPIPAELTTVLRHDSGAAEAVVQPTALERYYGINFLYKIPRPAGNGFELAPAEMLEIFVRSGNSELFQNTFGFLRPDPKTLTPNELYLLRSLDVVVVQSSVLCSRQNDVSLGNAFLNDYAAWVHQGLERFKNILVRQHKYLAQTGLPTVSLPNGELIPVRPLYKNNLLEYLDLGGRDIEATLKDLTKFQSFYDLRRPDEMLLRTRAQCEASTSQTGLTTGPIPEFVFDASGRFVTDKNGIPLIRLRSRVYCAFDPKTLGPLGIGELLTHEISHVERRLAQQKIFDYGEPDEHVTNDILSGQIVGYWLTRKSKEYLQNARAKFDRGDTSGFLFLVQTENPQILAGFPTSARFMVGTLSLLSAKFFADRTVGPNGERNGRAGFLAGGLGGLGLTCLALKPEQHWILS